MHPDVTEPAGGGSDVVEIYREVWSEFRSRRIRLSDSSDRFAFTTVENFVPSIRARQALAAREVASWEGHELRVRPRTLYRTMRELHERMPIELRGVETTVKDLTHSNGSWGPEYVQGLGLTTASYHTPSRKLPELAQVPVRIGAGHDAFRNMPSWQTKGFRKMFAASEAEEASMESPPTLAPIAIALAAQQAQREGAFLGLCLTSGYWFEEWLAPYLYLAPRSVVLVENERRVDPLRGMIHRAGAGRSDPARNQVVVRHLPPGMLEGQNAAIFRFDDPSNPRGTSWFDCTKDLVKRGGLKRYDVRKLGYQWPEGLPRVLDAVGF